MPGRDGTGPMSQGPMTGGGFGDCSLQEDMNYQTRNRFSSIGRGASCGRGRGFGRGFRNRPYIAVNNPQVDEKQYLKDELKNLEQEVNSVKTRLSEIDSK